MLAASVIPARKGQRAQLEPLVEAFLRGLGDQAEIVLSSYLDRAAAGLIQLITDEHRRFVAAPDYEEVVRLREFRPPVRHARPTTSRDRFGAFRRGVGYEGWKRSMFEQVWFDSSTERDLANVLDDAHSVEVWARLHPRDFELRYRGGTYNPDFLAAENGTRWVIEAKADRDLATENVQAKRRAAWEWANVVNADEQVTERWGYLLVSETDLKQAKGDWPALVQAAGAA